MKTKRCKGERSLEIIKEKVELWTIIIFYNQKNIYVIIIYKLDILW